MQVGDAWKRLIQVPPMSTLLAATAPSVEFAWHKYLAAHDAVVSAPTYNKCGCGCRLAHIDLRLWQHRIVPDAWVTLAIFSLQIPSHAHLHSPPCREPVLECSLRPLLHQELRKGYQWVFWPF